MQKKKTSLFIVEIIILTFVLYTISVFAYTGSGTARTNKPNDAPEYHDMEATAYCHESSGNIMADGSTYVFKGCCATRSRDIEFGTMAHVVDANTGEFIGLFEVRDRMNTKAKAEIDLCVGNKQECKEFGRRKVKVVWIKGVG